MKRSKHTYTKNVEAVVAYQNFDQKIEKASTSNSVPFKERSVSGKLNLLGREAYFEEYFNGVKVENQVFPKIGEFDNPSETVSFKMGYERGIFLVEQGIVPDKYKQDGEIKKHR